MKYDFSTVYDRRNTGSLKWSESEKGKPLEAAVPFSTADMEFAAPPQVRKAVADFAERGFYCYTVADETYRAAVCDFMKRRHNFFVSPEWIVPTYGIVSALNTAVRSLTAEGDGVIIQRPVYRPFSAAVENNGRKIVNNALVFKNGRYEINFEELEALCREERNTMMLLCSPHNPGSRVWSKEELTRVAELCHQNGVILVSDEIHFDIVKDEHNVLLTLDEKYRENTIVCTAISKSFNIAGLATSNIIIPSQKLREAFSAQIMRDGYSCINAAAYPATIAAYSECDDWLDEMNAVINENFEYMRRYLEEKLPELSMAEHGGTYLAWVDVSALGMDEEQLKAFFAEKVGIIPTMGTWFGEEGKGFIRLNIAVPKAQLERVLLRLSEALH